MYINHVKDFTLKFSWTHDAKVGHNVKSRAYATYIMYNRITDENGGNTSYEIDIPNGGAAFVKGNIIEQGPNTGNSVILSYAEEGASNPNSTLYVINNSFLNDKGSGTFVRNSASSAAVITNNIFVGGGTVVSGGSRMTTNLIGVDPRFRNRAAYDLHLNAGSPAIDTGVDPGMLGDVYLTPLWEYVHPASSQARAQHGAIDIGAFEY
jgi:hypothetical protein